jgi:hypothetical protein
MDGRIVAMSLCRGIEEFTGNAYQLSRSSVMAAPIADKFIPSSVCPRAKLRVAHLYRFYAAGIWPTHRSALHYCSLCPVVGGPGGRYGWAVWQIAVRAGSPLRLSVNISGKQALSRCTPWRAQVSSSRRGGPCH